MSDTEETFAFEAIGANGYAVVHHPTGFAWRFKVEKSQPLFLRSLTPQRTSDTPAVTKATSAVRRSAFQFAVAEARKLGVID